MLLDVSETTSPKPGGDHQSSGHSHSGQLTVNDIIIIDPDTLELDLNHGRIGKLQNLEPLTQIERLYLRWNLITKIENLSTLTTLKELELYDNQITKIEGLEALQNLEYAFFFYYFINVKTWLQRYVVNFLIYINIVSYW